MKARDAYRLAKLPGGFYSTLKKLRGEIEQAVAGRKLFVQVGLGWEHFDNAYYRHALDAVLDILRADDYEVAVEAERQLVTISWQHVGEEPAPEEPFPVGSRIYFGDRPLSEKQPDGSWKPVEEGEKEVLTVPEVAALLSVSVQRVYVLVEKETFFPPGVVVRVGRQVRFNKQALNQWVLNGGSRLQDEEGEA